MDILLSQIPTPILAVGGAAGEASGSWGGLLFYISSALAISFLCSVLEAILLSTSHSYVEMSIADGKQSGRLMRKHKSNLERPISAILTLNTIAHTVGAAGAGSEAVAIFGEAWFGVISAVLTFLILVFSEIIPKTIGATYWKQLNAFAAYTIEGMVWLLFPVIWLLEKTTQVLRAEEEHQPTVSRMEIETLSRIGASEGTLAERDYRILRNLLHLSSIHIHDIMTPRTVVLAFQQDLTVRAVLEKHPTLPYSRIPVYGEDMDDISGFILRHDLYYYLTLGEGDKPLADFKRSIDVMPESNDVAHVLDEFISKQKHIFLVIDEYGGTAGIVTMEDTLETLLGIEITDESDVVADLRKLAEQRYARQQKMLQGMNNSISLSNVLKETRESPEIAADENAEPD